MKRLTVILALAFACPDAGAAPADPLGPMLSDLSAVTRTREGFLGDPLNVVLVGTRHEVEEAFRAAGWYTTAPIRLRTAARISVCVALELPYVRAPVSNLYLFGRRQDLAFQRPCGRSPRSRHHVRFWCAGVGPDGRPVWVGAATFDTQVGRSDLTGRPTHRIDPNVDAERDTLFADLAGGGRLAGSYWFPRVGPFTGRNGGGDWYFTDGRLAVGVLVGDCRISRR